MGVKSPGPPPRGVRPAEEEPGNSGVALPLLERGDGEWLNVEALDLEARGVARNAGGKVVFIEGALPGEQVQADIRKRKHGWEQGSLAALRRPSSQRVDAACPHFGLHAGACGGCKMQHLHTGAQVAIKQRVLEDALWHLGKIKPGRMLRPIEGPAFGYRDRARLSVRYVAKKGGVLVGFHERQSSYVADMRSCAVLPPHVAALLLPLRELIGSMDVRDRIPQLELAVGDEITALVVRHLEPLGVADRVRLRCFAVRYGVQWWLQPGGPQTAHPLDDAATQLAYRLPEFDITMPFAPTDFTQVNAHINRVLVARAVRLLAPARGERVIDWFCGLGNFTLPMARCGSDVLGVEGSGQLISRARRNAASNGLADRARFVSSNLFELSADGLRAFGAADKWLIDPPREGAFALVKALSELLSSTACWAPSRIVMVSCNPATLARDAGVLVHQAGYRCTSAGAINMFPHTAHVESIAVFNRDASA